SWNVIDRMIEKEGMSGIGHRCDRVKAFRAAPAYDPNECIALVIVMAVSRIDPDPGAFRKPGRGTCWTMRRGNRQWSVETQVGGFQGRHRRIALLHDWEPPIPIKLERFY